MTDKALFEPERRLMQAVATGAVVDVSTGDPAVDDPVRAADWTTDRTVRAEWVARLVTGPSKPETGHLRAVRLRGARLVGVFDLEQVDLLCPVELENCHFESAINLQEARALVIRLRGCHVPEIAADQLHIRGDLDLAGIVTTQGGVRLRGARVGATLDFSRATLDNPGGLALDADGLTVDRYMYCRAGFTARGEVNLYDAHVRASLDFGTAALSNRDGTALRAARVTVDRNMYCCDGFTAQGEVNLVSARIGASLDFSTATLSNRDGSALVAASVVVGEEMRFRERFVAQGAVNLQSAHVGATLSFSAATLTNPSGFALDADGLTVDRYLHCRAGFTAQGEVNLYGARVGATLDFSNATLTNPHGTALRAARITVDRSIYCRAGFTAQGEVNLYGARVGATLDLSTATFSNRDGTALSLERATSASLWLVPGSPPAGTVILTNARTGSFYDTPDTWPIAMHLRGFVYEVLENDNVGVSARLGWLSRHQIGYAPGLYDQLAAAYRRSGHTQAARRVVVAKQWRRRADLNILGKAWNWLLYLTVGYGYRPWLAGLWLAVLLAVGTAVFGGAYPTEMYSAAMTVPGFQPIAYTLDVLLPIVDLGQEKNWYPRGATRVWSWVLTGAGWVLTTAVVAGLTNALKRD